jgi:hypothetical protein
LGATSSGIPVNLTNPLGAATLTNLKLGATGAFKVASTNCPSTLTASANCQASLTFSPTSAGSQTGDMTVASDTLTVTEFLPLNGVGFDFTMADATATSQTVTNGQAAVFPLTFSLVSQSSDAVLTLSCDTSAASFPPYASCAFSPSTTPQVPAAAAGGATVTIATGQSQASAAMRPWRLAPLTCGLVLLPLALWRRRPLWMRSKVLLLAVLLVLLAGSASSCTSSGISVGGGTPLTGPGITPAGKYQIPVNAVSNGVKHTVTLTLIVD